jgi:hypothetical protein
VDLLIWPSIDWAALIRRTTKKATRDPTKSLLRRRCCLVVRRKTYKWSSPLKWGKYSGCSWNSANSKILSITSECRSTARLTKNLCKMLIDKCINSNSRWISLEPSWNNCQKNVKNWLAKILHWRSNCWGRSSNQNCFLKRQIGIMMSS